jgi:putative heme-binding domain-containing protein
MRFCLLLCASALSTAAIAQTRPALAPPTDTAAGKQIFDSQCAWCHGTDGEGGTGPNLRGKLSHATDLTSIADVIQNGIPGTEMPALGLTERSSRQTAAYVQSLSRATPRPVAGNAQRGAALYQAQGCASCHVVRGQGGVLGPELTAIATRRGAPYLRDALVKPESTHPPRYVVVRAVPVNGPEIRGNRVNEDVFWIQIRDTGGTVHSLDKSTLTRLDRQLDATLMPSYATRLSAAELDDLVAYLVTLRGDH